MYIGVKEVRPINDYKLDLTFENGEKKVFDMKPYLDIGIFKELKNKELFNTVHISFDTIEWDNHADFDPEVLYQKSERLNS